ncbi:hypothetical protein Lsai_2290 [Legionella sainthelensi]|uniref:Uncharacterized protein n=1 Tax=Legionella sainthelensi TaxID=28087 RepID=A0A0W0YGZ6_9GAMM|nr:hypothetical protein [Legionella sainthelensi]KTD56160.1 hypothetical protein Lsai_2290 [Legionella sainthelensi]VEH35131.1 Uncharacterised protein [Legionella sainthelensi]
MSVKANFQGGLDLNFFAKREFESTEGVAPSKQASIIARNAARFLMMGWTDSWTQFLTPTVLNAVFVKRDHELLRELRLAFQQGFIEIFEQLKDKELTEEQKEQVQLYLSNCLTLLPYGDLTPYESIKIPQYIEGTWEMVEYQITPIELTETSGWQRFFIQDKDRVFAYGLEPLFQKKAESHLIFMGTTYPAGQGFVPQVNTDSKGFETVGKSLYRTGRARVQEWLCQQENSIHVCGVSLGGSLSLLLAIDQGNYKLSRVDALNPAGLHDAWSKSRYDYWDSLNEKPRVVVQKQGDDPVSAFGIWKTDWDIFHVIPPKDKRGPISFCDHFLNYAGFADTQFDYIQAEQDNSKRLARNFWLYSLGRSLIYYCFLTPYTYLIRPLVHLVSQNWVLSAHIVTFCVAASLAVAGVIPGLIFLGIAGGLLASSLIYSTLPAMKNNSKEITTKNKYVEKGLAELHDPSLSRNPTMDIYNEDNAIEVDFTYQQIHTYYHLMRSLKNKDFIPYEEKESKHVKGITKKALLENSQNPKNADVVISFKVTKAKAAHIQHTLSFVKKLGSDNEQLKAAVGKSYSNYCMGKYA